MRFRIAIIEILSRILDFGWEYRLDFHGRVPTRLSQEPPSQLFFISFFRGRSEEEGTGEVCFPPSWWRQEMDGEGSGRGGGEGQSGGVKGERTRFRGNSALFYCFLCLIKL